MDLITAIDAEAKLGGTLDEIDRRMDRLLALDEVLKASIEQNLDKVRLLFLDLASSKQAEHRDEAALLGIPLMRAEYARGEAITNHRYTAEMVGWWTGLLTDESPNASETVYIAINSAMEDQTMPPGLMELIVHSVTVDAMDLARRVQAHERRLAGGAS